MGAVKGIQHLPTAGNGTDLTDYASKGTSLRDILKSEGKIKRFSIVNGADMIKLDPDPVQWIVEGLIAKDTKSVLGGMTGSNKSYFGMELGISISYGVEKFMDYDIREQMKVLYVNLEVSDSEVHRRYKNITKNLGVSKRINKNFMWNTNLEGSFQDQWDDIDGMITQERPDLVIVDNLYASTGVNLSRNNEIKQVLGTIDDVVKRHGITLMLIAHFNKSQGEMELSLERMQGASSLQNWLEFSILLGKSTIDPDLRLMKIGKSRFSFVPSQHMMLKWTEETYLFEKLGIADNPAAHFVANKKAENWSMALDDLPEEFDREMFVNVVQFSLGKTQRTADRWLKNMESLGFIKKKYKNVWTKTDLKIISEDED